MIKYDVKSCYKNILRITNVLLIFLNFEKNELKKTKKIRVNSEKSMNLVEIAKRLTSCFLTFLNYHYKKLIFLWLLFSAFFYIAKY